jgi:hypothetical protein
VRRSFDILRDEIDHTGDVLSQALARLAEGRALDLIGSSDAIDVAAEGWSRMHQLGVEATGWITAFDRGLGTAATDSVPA